MAFVICCQITLQNLWSFYILNILLQEKNEEKEKSIGLLESETRTGAGNQLNCQISFYRKKQESRVVTGSKIQDKFHKEQRSNLDLLTTELLSNGCTNLFSLPLFSILFLESKEENFYFSLRQQSKQEFASDQILALPLVILTMLLNFPGPQFSNYSMEILILCPLYKVAVRVRDNVCGAIISSYGALQRLERITPSENVCKGQNAPFYEQTEALCQLEKVSLPGEAEPNRMWGA